jgi:hypothetical protein
VLSHAVLDSSRLNLAIASCAGPRRKSGGCGRIISACVDNQWYLFAFDLARQQLRTFALPRIREPRRSRGRVSVRPANFSIGKFLDSSFGVFQSDGRHHGADSIPALSRQQLVRERIWHHSQRIKELREGGLELQLQLGQPRGNRTLGPELGRAGRSPGAGEAAAATARDRGEVRRRLTGRNNSPPRENLFPLGRRMSDPLL